MNAHDLPLVGEITNTNKDFVGAFTDLQSKKVLCIGFSEPEVKQFVAKYGPAKLVMLTNWTEHQDAQVQDFPLVLGDIDLTPEFSTR